MKYNRLFLLISMQAALLSAMAQPTLTSSVIPVAGTTIRYQLGNAATFNQGNAGANVTWNFSAMDTTSTIIPFQYLTASQTPNGSSFPAANLCINAGGNYSYYEVNNSAYINRGAQGPYSLYYSVGEKLLSFPFAYNNSFTSNFSFDVQSAFNRGGSTTVIADGYGTLQLPHRTIYNVLRTKTIETYRDSFYLGGLIYSYADTLYNWYTSGIAGSLLESYHFVTSGGASQDISSVYFFHSLSTGVKEITADVNFSLYPNPASNQVLLALDKAETEPVKISLMDIEGRILKEYLNQGETQALDISEFQNGVYLVSLSTPTAFLGTRKLNIAK